MSEVVLYGELREKFGKSFSLEVHSAAEAVRALCAVLPGFKDFVVTSEDRSIGYRVLVDEIDRGLDELHNPVGSEKIKIIPAILGSKSKATKIILGAVMIYAGVQMGGMTDVSGGIANMTATQIAGKLLINFGMSMVFSGIAEYLAPDPKAAVEAPENYFFDGPVNTQRQGVPIPIAYGLVRVGGSVINAYIVAQDKD
jgi:predicted phage tail protein